jgi:single-strand DNA-binding protein
MSAQNSVNLIGRLVEDPQVELIGEKETPLLKNTLAVRQAGGKKDGEWQSGFFPIEVWGKSAEIVAQYSRKGSNISVYGQLEQQKWVNNEGENRSRMIIKVFDIGLIDPKPADGEETKPAPSKDSGPSEEEDPFADL